ncbi:MAG: barstar family protein [Planctomycetaceae bacterium]|jgi:RNAse (barnase) inhibitor barstar|nr:barstar family protein [Planctomycetaceae bacterium]
MDNFIFLDHPQELNMENSHVIIMNSSITSKEELMSDFNIKLCLPNYFAHNWDSLYDCLFSLDWIEQQNLVLIYEYIPNLDNETLVQLLSILKDAMNTWNKDDRYQIHIVFPKNSYQRIHELI